MMSAEPIRIPKLPWPGVAPRSPDFVAGSQMPTRSSSAIGSSDVVDWALSSNDAQVTPAVDAVRAAGLEFDLVGYDHDPGHGSYAMAPVDLLAPGDLTELTGALVVSLTVA
jgi:hypothetical protein